MMRNALSWFPWRILCVLPAAWLLAGCSREEGPRIFGCVQNYVFYESYRGPYEAALIVFECGEEKPYAASIVMYPVGGAPFNGGQHTRIATLFATQQQVDMGLVELTEQGAPPLSFRWVSDTELEIEYDPVAMMPEKLDSYRNVKISYKQGKPAINFNR